MTGVTPSEVDVLVVGAGQVGLAAGYWLRQSKRTFVILDRAARIGESWRQRCDSLTLFTPRAFSEWEKLFWLLKFLIPKLAIKDPGRDPLDELLETVDLSSYGLERVKLAEIGSLDR